MSFCFLLCEVLNQLRLDLNVDLNAQLLPSVCFLGEMGWRDSGLMLRSRGFVPGLRSTTIWICTRSNWDMRVAGFEPRLSKYPGYVQWKTFTDTMRWLVFSPLPHSEISKLMPMRYLYLLVFFYRNPFMKWIVWNIAHLVKDGPEPALTTMLIFYCWATDWGWVLLFPWVKLLCIHT